MQPKTCPSQESLQQLLLGKLTRPEAEQLEEHLLQCDNCSASANRNSASDELTEAVHACKVVDDDDRLTDAIERAKQLYVQVATVESSGATSPILPERAHAAPPDRRTIPKIGDAIEILNPPEEPDEIGRLGGYRVLELLGSGGMGVVFRAEDPRLKRQIVLKVMKPEVAARESAKARFLREAQAAAAIEHHHIVPIYQVGEDRGVPFIAMQLLHGESLQTKLDREGRMPPRAVAKVGKEIAAGLAAAHKRDLIHRDIKPDNIWLEEESGWAKILDFGLARTGDDDAGLTHSGTVLGTPKYMAPEQAKGEVVDHRSDLFSLGSVLYHVTSGRPPFEGRNLTAVLLAVSQADCTPIEEVCPELNLDLANLIGRLLSKTPDDRPQSAAEVAEALSEIENKLAVADPVTAHPGIVVDTTGVSQSTVAKRISTQRNVLRNSSYLVATVATLILLVFSGLYYSGILFKIETEEGTLIVKATGDNFTTSVKGQKVKIANTETKETIEINLDSPETIKKLKPGRYQFLFTTSSGLTARTERFVIRSGDDEVVRVWWEPKETPPLGNALPHAPFDVVYEEPEVIFGFRDLPETVFDSDQPEILIDKEAIEDASKLRIVRLWFQSEDLVPSENNKKVYRSRAIKSWVPSETWPQSSVELVASSQNAVMTRVRPRSRLADGVYCIVEGPIGDDVTPPKFSAPFIIRGVSRAGIDSMLVTVKADKVDLAIKIHNLGKGELNDGRLVVTLQRVTGKRPEFSGRFSRQVSEIPAGESEVVEIQADAADLQAGRYYFLAAVRPTHQNSDQNEMAEGESEEFEIPSASD